MSTFTCIIFPKYINRGTRFAFIRSFSQKSSWKSTIGLEIHAQVASKTKLFSNAETLFAAAVNSNVNLLDAGIPGTLPTLNEECVKHAVLTSLALSCQVQELSHFDRKHYFYADLPCGYQITQQRSPIATDGYLNFHVYTPGVHKSPYKKSCRLKQIQLEQDSGKSLHDVKNHKSLIDLNRAGVPLMEFVFEPDLCDGEEAAALVKELILILQRLKSCSCKMEEGALRVDANVSVSNDDKKLGVRTEIKNIGSVRGVANAIKFEIERQINVLKKGGKIINETRSWDPQRKLTVSMRDKEEKQDYRFMPEPNLPPLRIALAEKASIGKGVMDARNVKKRIPELPESSREYLMNNYGFTNVYSIMLVNQPKLYDYFKILMEEKQKRDSKLVWNVLMVQLLNVLYNNEKEPDNSPIELLHIGEIVDLLSSGEIDLETCRNIIEIKLKGSESTPRNIVESNKWHLVSNPILIDELCKEVISRNPKAVKKYLKGKDKSLQTIVNDVANITSDKINLSKLSKRLKELLKNDVKQEDK